eukprot:3544551-Amphidinium_carterae.1
MARAHFSQRYLPGMACQFEHEHCSQRHASQRRSPLCASSWMTRMMCRKNVLMERRQHQT